MTKQGTREPTRRLADFGARLRNDDLLERTREHCKVEAFGSVRELMALLRASPQTRAMAAAE